MLYAVFADTIVQVWSSAAPCAAYPTDYLADVYAVLPLDKDFTQMAVQRAKAVAMAKANVFPDCSSLPRRFDNAFGRGIHLLSSLAGKIYACVMLVLVQYGMEAGPIVRTDVQVAEIFSSQRRDARNTIEVCIRLLEQEDRFLNLAIVAAQIE